MRRSCVVGLRMATQMERQKMTQSRYANERSVMSVFLVHELVLLLLMFADFRTLLDSAFDWPGLWSRMAPARG